MEADELIKKIHKKSNKVSIIFLVIIIVGLLGVCSYIFLIKPYLQKLVTESVQYGVQYTIYNIANEAVQCKTIPLQVNNITINLIATQCL